MKKIILLIVLLIMPVIVNGDALTGSNCEISSEENCVSVVNGYKENMKSNTSLLKGKYYYYNEVICDNGKNKINSHYDFKCSNGNSDPKAAIVASGNGEKKYDEGAACGSDNGKVYAYFTVVIDYDCNLTSSGSTYTEPTTSTTKTTTSKKTTTSSVVEDDSDEVQNSDTGVGDYYLVLSVSAVALSGLAYVLNKKNVLKDLNINNFMILLI